MSCENVSNLIPQQTAVIQALHATHKDTAWMECSGRVGASMKNVHSQASITLLPDIMEKIPVLIFAGDQDVICNYVGQEMMLEKMTWAGKTGMGVSASFFCKWTN
jgi:carboxypeptidase D